MVIRSIATGPIMVNTYVAYDETKKGFIVDPGGFSQVLADYIKENEVEIEYIILTHGHGDHIGGVKAFMDLYPNAKLVAYKDERELLQDPMKNVSRELSGTPVTLEADIYVSDGDTLKVGDTTLTFIHTPGHTKGGMSIVGPGFVFSGDTLFRGSIGRTDFYGGSFPEIMKSIKERLFLLPDDTVVYPGHMEPTTIEYEKRNNPFV